MRRSLRRRRGGQRVHHLLDCEAQLLEPPNQQDPIQIAPVEGAVATGGPGRWMQHAAALVEANRVDGNPRLVGKVPESAWLSAIRDPLVESELTLDHGPEFTVTGMTKLLTIAASPDAPVACDLTSPTTPSRNAWPSTGASSATPS